MVHLEFRKGLRLASDRRRSFELTYVAADEDADCYGQDVEK
jgi:hypothetical protein